MKEQRPQKIGLNYWYVLAVRY